MRLVALGIFLAGCLFSSGWAQAEAITIATGEFPPWTSEKEKHGGFVNRVVAEAFAREGILVNFVYLPWKRVEAETRLGRYAASSFWFTGVGPEADFLVSDPISSHRELLFRLKERPLPKWRTLADLRGRKFGATLGYTYTSEFWKMARSGKINVEVASHDELNFKKVLAGRIDAFPMEEVSGWMLLANSEAFPPGTRELFVTEQRPLRVTEGHLRFPRRLAGSAKLAARFNAGLAEMKKDGTYDRYLQDLVK